MEVINNKKQKQFEVFIDDHKAELVYRFRKGTMFFMHTYVPEAIGGKGIASALASTALTYAKDNGYKIAVLCPFVAAYVKKHPEWYTFYDTGYHQNIPVK